jgi:NAD(P)-dependent dehydrogenase (short-subunit alcohol dehydrogenase family)
MRLQGKVVLVTGAARRVGSVIAKALGQRGAKVAIHYNHSRREAERLADDIQDGFGRDAAIFKADLSDARQVKRLAENVAKRFGQLHVLVNNASLYEKSDFAETTLADWNAHLDVNLRAPFLLSQALAPVMQKSGGGHIINIADWAAHRPYTDYIPYCVSKAGLVCLNQALAKELAPDIQVNAILPGPVMLPDATSRRGREAILKATLLKKLGTPEDIARAILFLIEEGDFITGASIPVDGGRLIA